MIQFDAVVTSYWVVSQLGLAEIGCTVLGGNEQRGVDDYQLSELLRLISPHYPIVGILSGTT